MKLWIAYYAGAKLEIQARDMVEARKWAVMSFPVPLSKLSALKVEESK